MSEIIPPARRRASARVPRTTGPALAPLGRLEVPWSPLEILTAEQVERILVAAFRVLEEAGLEIRSVPARALLRAAGAIVDEDTQIVRIGRELVEAQLAHAPESFVLHARNPLRHLHVGGRTVNFGPVNGAPNSSDADRGRRFGDIASFRDILKLTHKLGVLHWQGGIVVEPVDVPVPVRHLAAPLAPSACRVRDGEAVQAAQRHARRDARSRRLRHGLGLYPPGQHRLLESDAQVLHFRVGRHRSILASPPVAQFLHPLGSQCGKTPDALFTEKRSRFLRRRLIGLE
jgi:trimethylamine:corrinoid methyltransferase-like protein